jgi:hypothetical protein
MMKLLDFEYELSLDTRLRACDEGIKLQTLRYGIMVFVV